MKHRIRAQERRNRAHSIRTLCIQYVPIEYINIRCAVIIFSEIQSGGVGI